MTETPRPMIGSPAWIAEQPAAIAAQQDSVTMASETVAACLAVLADAARDLAAAEATEAHELAKLERLRAELAEWTQAAEWAGDLATVHELRPAGIVDAVDRAEHAAADRLLAEEKAEAEAQHAADLAAAADAYPQYGEDLAALIAAGMTADVARRVVAYVDALNRQDVERNSGGPFPRMRLYRVKQPARGARYARIVSASQPGPATYGSAEAFVELATGDLYKPDGWKRPAPGIRGSFRDDESAARIYTPSGAPGSLYRR